MSTDQGVRVTAVDLDTGQRNACTLRPGKRGQYAVFVAEPMYQASEHVHADGTVVITLRHRGDEDTPPPGSDSRPTGLTGATHQNCGGKVSWGSDGPACECGKQFVNREVLVLPGSPMLAPIETSANGGQHAS